MSHLHFFARLLSLLAFQQNTFESCKENLGEIKILGKEL